MRHSTYLDVQMPMLERNFKLIQGLAPKAKVLPMVKGDAYGHGVVPVSEFLVQKLGCKRLGVASLGEALRICDSIPAFASNPEMEVVVFSDTELQNAELRKHYFKYQAKIIPVVGTVTDLDLMLGNNNDVDAEALSQLSKLPLFIKVNTGMNRMGVLPDELKARLDRIKTVRGKVDHLLQHFSTSYIKASEGDTTMTQYKTFKEVQRMIEEHGVPVAETSTSNSGAIEQQIGVEETWVRPGLMLYGPPSITEPQVIWKGEQVSSWYTKVIKTYIINTEKACVGYGFNAVRSTPCFIVLLPVGYADGFLRYNRGLKIAVNGIEGEVHGNVNMDMAQLAFYPSETKLSVEEMARRIKQEDVVAIWSHNNLDITAKAEFLQTNAYQLMCAVSTRVPRVYTYEEKKAQ